jgi:hypothetical protein
MKYIKINTIVNLTSGVQIPSGSAVIIAEGYADVKSQVEGFIPAQIATFVYASYEAMVEGKQALQGIADFATTFSYAKLPVTSFETVPAETLLVEAVYAELALVYGESNIEIVTIV